MGVTCKATGRLVSRVVFRISASCAGSTFLADYNELEAWMLTSVQDYDDFEPHLVGATEDYNDFEAGTVTQEEFSP